MPERGYLTVSEISTLLRISRPTIYKMIRSGKIKAINTGRKYVVEWEALNKNPLKLEGENKGVQKIDKW